MRIPTTKRSQILGARGASQVADPSSARARGESLAGFGQSLKSFASDMLRFKTVADKEKKSAAIYRAETEFLNFKRAWNAKKGSIKGEDYEKKYEEAYSQHFGAYLKENPEFQKEVTERLDRLRATEVLDVQSAGMQKEAKEIRGNSKTYAQQNLALVHQNPESFREVLANTVTFNQSRVESGNITQKEANDEMDYLSKELIKQTVTGYKLQGRFKEARAFLENREVALTLGSEETNKRYDKLVNDHIQRTSETRGQIRWEDEVRTKEEKRKEDKALFDLMRSAKDVETAGGIQQLERAIEKKERELGYTGLKKARDMVQDARIELSDETSFKVYRQFYEAEDQSDYDRIRSGILRHKSRGELTAKEASALENKLRVLEEQDEANPAERDAWKALQYQIRQYYDVGDFEKLSDIKETYKKSFLGTMAKVYELRASGMPVSEIGPLVLGEASAMRGDTLVSPVSNMKLTKQSEALDDLTKNEKLFRRNLISPETYEDNIMTIDGILRKLDVLQKIPNTPSIPYAPVPKKEQEAKSTENKYKIR